MYYVDTSVLASYLMASDSGHDASRKALEPRAHKLYTSTYALAELHSAICRRILREKQWKLIDQLQRYLDAYKEPDKKCRFLLSMIVSLLRERLGIVFLEEAGFYDLVNVDDFKMPWIFREAVELSPKLLIRTKDLLHLAYAFAFSNAYGVRYFLTRDLEDFERVKDEVEKLLKIEIVLIK